VSVPKQSYHHGNLPAALVAAAIDLLAEHGPKGVAVREAARRAGVSPGAPYKHFDDRAALLAAVAAEGARRITDAMDRAAAQASDDAARPRSRGIAYVAFAAAHPALFRVMYAPAHAAGVADALAGWELPERCRVHGLARLFVDGHLAGNTPADVERIAASVLT
jgi:AcrR family transcriptional regulator